ncbi:MAG: hypothetical protein M1816_005136 [Peltula sp. TS41687]|nr:MAG: hypothetical protein M1816_005136 [Peltula sp. TS41687]
MAHHHQRRFNPVQGTHDFRILENMPTATESSFTLDEELTTEADEPPDRRFTSGSSPSREPGSTFFSGNFAKINPPRRDRKESLLTHAFAPSPESKTSDHTEEAMVPTLLARGHSTASTTSCLSIGSTAELTSDGGLTSPARTSTPSPPPPVTVYVDPLDPLNKMEPLTDIVVRGGEIAPRGPITNEHADVPLHAPAVNTALGRKSCIRFACANKISTGNVASNNKTENLHHMENPKTEEKPKRPCALRFICPFKDNGQDKPLNKLSDTHRKYNPPPPAVAAGNKLPVRGQALPLPQSIDHATPSINIPKAGDVHPGVTEARRFHEFASSADEGDDWMNEKSDHNRKLTVNDTLQKEKSIQKLAEEVEAEALEEADAQNEVDPEDDEVEAAEDEEEDGDEDANESISDDGNESDDEGGFADSDDESDSGSEYQFWTTGPSTAATSMDLADHNRRHPRKLVATKSLDSIAGIESSKAKRHVSPPLSSRIGRQAGLQVGTPPLPDSTDFVCGTLDEDRPLEDAYASALEQRKRSTHTTIPQDIDPSFPTSDVDDDDEEDDDAAKDGTSIIRVKGNANDSDEGPGNGERRAGHRGRSPIPSPRRLHSPPPLRRTTLARSPPPRRLMKSPDPRHRLIPAQNLECQAPSHPSSTAVSPKNQGHVRPFQFAHRPGLLRATSLPRSPNPFYQQLRKGHPVIVKGASSRPSSPNGHRSRKALHRRGAIDIVCGLEQKRQRRKEKAWFKLCQRGAKCKEQRKPLPGQGAERMRWVGLEKAGKNKAHGLVHNVAKYVLSI